MPEYIYIHIANITPYLTAYSNCGYFKLRTFITFLFFTFTAFPPMQIFYTYNAPILYFPPLAHNLARPVCHLSACSKWPYIVLYICYGSTLLFLPAYHASTHHFFSFLFLNLNSNSNLNMNLSMSIFFVECQQKFRCAAAKMPPK